MESRLEKWPVLREVHSSPATCSRSLSSTSTVQIHFRFDQINSIIKEQVQVAMDDFYRKHSMAYSKLELFMLEKHLVESKLHEHDRHIDDLVHRCENLSSVYDELGKVLRTISSQSKQNSMPSEQMSQCVIEEQQQDQQQQEQEQLSQNVIAEKELKQELEPLPSLHSQSQATRDNCVHFMPDQCSTVRSRSRSRKTGRTSCASRTISRSNSRSCSRTSSCTRENNQGYTPTAITLPSIDAAVSYVDKNSPDNVKEVLVIYHNPAFKLLPIKHANSIAIKQINQEQRMIARKRMQRQQQHQYRKSIKSVASTRCKEQEHDMFKLNMMLRKSSCSMQLNRFKFPFVRKFYNLGKKSEKRKVYDPQHVSY